MKHINNICCAIFLFCLIDVRNVHSAYNSNGYDNRNLHHGNNFVNVNDSPKSECPPDFTGHIPYAMDCRQYLNCWRGRGTIQSCSPGTMFNPKTMECDHPSKVKCERFEGLSTRQQIPPSPNARQYTQRQEIAPIQCESGASGLFAHPLDCKKFLNCDHGRTFTQECGPGTVFNDVFKVCDWPHKVDCGSRNPNGQAEGELNSEASNHEPFYGEGMLDSRMGLDSRAHSAPPFPQQNIRNHQQYPQQNVQNQYQHPQHTQPPPQHHQLNQQHWPQYNPNTYQRPTQPYGSQPSNDGINSNSLSSFSSIEPAEAVPSQSFITPNTVDSKLDFDNLHTIPEEPSPKTEIVNIPSRELLPPFKDTEQHVGGFTNNRSGRVDDSLQGSKNPREDIGGSNHPVNEWTRGQQEPLDTNILGGQGPQYVQTTESSIDHSILRTRKPKVENRATSQPKSTSKVPAPPSTTTVKPPKHVAPTKVYGIYPSGFETIGSKCEEDGTGLMSHPYDCNRYVSCENGRIRVQSCESGLMFNPTLKMCDFAHNVKECSAGVPVVNPNEFPQAEIPDEKINEIDDAEGQKPFQVDLRASEFDSTEANRVNVPTQTDRYPYYIPDMSVLPLETDKYPQNTYPVSQKPPVYNGYGKPSQGGDIPLEDFDGRNFLLGNSPNPTNRNREGKVAVLGGNALFHGEPALNGGQTTPTPSIASTTEAKNVMKIPQGKEHVMPIYHRPTRPTTTTNKPYSVLQSPNQMYYQPFTKPINETEEKDETDYIAISEALKYLLKPYIGRNETKAPNNTEHMNKIENKLLDIMDDGQSANHNKALEQDSLALGILNENVAVKNLPDTPFAHVRSNIDFDAFEAAPQNNKNIEVTTEHKPPSAHFHSTNNHHSHHPNHAHLPTDVQPSTDFDAAQPHLNQPTYYKPGTNEPVQITFPGPHTQSHPMHGYNHHSAPSSASYHSSPTPPMTHSSHHHNGNHVHSGPNYHTNAANFGLAQNNRNTEPTTGSAPPPNWYPTQDKSFAQARIGKSEFEVSSCDGQFDCGTGFCIPFSRICDGKDDCGNRRDEQSCPHVNYQVRLSHDKGHKHMGRVEVKAFGKWGYVCDDKFTLTNANILCRELGFNMGAAEVKPNSFFPPNKNMPAGQGTFQMDEVNCMGNETSLKDCDFNGWGVSDCNAEEVVGVVCKVSVMKCPAGHWLCPESEECVPMSFMCDGIKDCTDGTDESAMHCKAEIEYRLMDGTDLEGRVEVKYRGVWGTVCDDDFGNKEAQVFCNSLGFNGPASVLRSRHGMSAGPIWLDQVDCLGNETALDKCMHFEWSESNCNHTEDVSVKCSYGSNAKSSRYTADENALQRLTNRETHDYLRDVEPIGKSVADHSNTCGRIKVTEADDMVESVGQFRVISGQKTKRGHHPWQATIRARGRNGRSTHWCGAVIISKTHILTAAHCLVGFAKGAYYVRAGDHHSEIREESEVEVFIEDWYIHKEFRNGQLMNNDIALILLKNPIQFTNYIQPICLPDEETRYVAGKNCTISGWGTIQYGKSTPSLDLKAASVPLIAQDICRQKEYYGENIMDTMFCAGYLDKSSSVDACEGDSGGPLVCADENGVHSLYGIISWGQRCGDSTKPGVYVKVKQYLDWIKEKMNLLN